jgi:hypothetical protein
MVIGGLSWAKMKRDWGCSVAEVVENLPSKLKALNSNPSTTKINK